MSDPREMFRISAPRLWLPSTRRMARSMTSRSTVSTIFFRSSVCRRIVSIGPDAAGSATGAGSAPAPPRRATEPGPRRLPPGRPPRGTARRGPRAGAFPGRGRRTRRLPRGVRRSASERRSRSPNARFARPPGPPLRRCGGIAGCSRNVEARARKPVAGPSSPTAHSVAANSRSKKSTNAVASSSGEAFSRHQPVDRQSAEPRYSTLRRWSDDGSRRGAGLGVGHVGRLGDGRVARARLDVDDGDRRLTDRDPVPGCDRSAGKLPAVDGDRVDALEEVDLVPAVFFEDPEVPAGDPAGANDDLVARRSANRNGAVRYAVDFRPTRLFADFAQHVYLFDVNPITFGRANKKKSTERRAARPALALARLSPDCPATRPPARSPAPEPQRRGTFHRPWCV